MRVPRTPRSKRPLGARRRHAIESPAVAPKPGGLSHQEQPCRTKNSTCERTLHHEIRIPRARRIPRRNSIAANSSRRRPSPVRAAPSSRPRRPRAPSVQTPPRVPSALPPNEHVAAAETDVPNIPPYSTEGRPGSDFMVDVIKTLDIKYLPANPASSYRAIHESLIDYGKNTMPEFLTCTHEEAGVGIAHGYYKIANKPLMTLCHGTVGLMHATMNVYNAFCDRAAGDRGHRQRSRRRPSAARRADRPFGAGHQRDRARLHQMGRHAGVGAALRPVVRPRLPDRHHAALRAGRDLARRRIGAGADQGLWPDALYPEIRAHCAAGRRTGRRA